MTNDLRKNINHTRRNVLKSISAGGAVMLAPVIAQATNDISQINAVDTVQFRATDINGLSIEFSDAGASNVHADLVRVSISNLNNKQVTLTKLSPGGVVVNGREYNLNSQLSRGAITVKPNSVHHLWLSPVRKGKDTHPQLAHHARSGMVTVTVARSHAGQDVQRHSQLAHACIA